MRILFVSRVAPNCQGRPIERRFANRLEELTALGHEALVLSRWEESLPDRALPQRVEIRYPFRSFAAWEWPRALPLVLQWRPDILHIVDFGLSAYDRLLGAEAAVFPVIEGLRRGLRRAALPRILVSTVESIDETWNKIGATHIESQWLSEGLIQGLSASSGLKSSLPELQSFNQPQAIQIFLAGTPSERNSLFLKIPAIIDNLRLNPELEVSCLLSRTELSRSQQRDLKKWERQQPHAASHLRLIPEKLARETLASQAWDVGIVAALPPQALQSWQAHLAMPLIYSEGQQEFQREGQRSFGQDPRFMACVSEVAWMEQSLSLCRNETLRKMTWERIHEKALHVLQDDATNRISRLYADALALNNSPS